MGVQQRKVRPSLRQDGPSNPEPDRDTTQHPYWPQNLCNSDAKPIALLRKGTWPPVSLQKKGTHRRNHYGVTLMALVRQRSVTAHRLIGARERPCLR